MGEEVTVLRTDVVALYVDPRGPYPGLVADWYDETRDARTYAGPLPVVAHPPCRLWSSLKHLAGDGDIKRERWKDGTAEAAMNAVRSWGGVLEQPAGSKMWDVFGFPKPGDPSMDPWGGLSWEVQQCDWGHPARKRTWLYCVRTGIPQRNVSHREPTHWCSGGGSGRGKTPPGIKVCSAQQRRRTPPAFAAWLLDLAASAGR